MLVWGFKDVDTGGGAGVPGTVGVSSQDTVHAGWMLSTEGRGRLDHTRVCTGVEGSSLRRCTWTLKSEWLGEVRRQNQVKRCQRRKHRSPRARVPANVPTDSRQPHTHRGAQTKPQRRLSQATVGHASFLGTCFTSSFEFSHATASTLTRQFISTKHRCVFLFFFFPFSSHNILCCSRSSCFATYLRWQQEVLDGLRVLQELDLLHDVHFSCKHHRLVHNPFVWGRDERNLGGSDKVEAKIRNKGDCVRGPETEPTASFARKMMCPR